MGITWQSLGQQIKKVREGKKISQQKLADKITNLNQSQIAKIEKGTRKTTAIDLISIAKALNVSVSELITE